LSANAPIRTLTLRELNRALLARQLLLEHVSMPVPDTIEQLVGLQAQIPYAPYMGLWTRLRNFQRDDLATLIENRQVVKATLMRGTLHFFTAAGYARHRATVRSGLMQPSGSTADQRPVDVDMDHLLAEVAHFVEEQPRPYQEITAFINTLYPGIGHIDLPLVHVPDAEKRWSYPGSPRYTLADRWIGMPIAPEGDLREFILRYLKGYGPASPADMKAWSRFKGLREEFEALRPELVTYRDEQGRELFDLPDTPLPDPDTPAPIRFIPQLDNLLIGHDDRARIIAYEHRAPVMKVNGQGSITVLVDGFVRAMCSLEAKKTTAKLTIQPFAALDAPTRTAITEEAERLLRFLHPDISTAEVLFAI
jgi:hypothetical protein